MPQEVEKYSKPARIFHHAHTVAFVLLFLTGLILFIPQLGFLAQGSWTRLIHRIFAAVFVIAPIVYFFMRPRAALLAIKDVLVWGKEDIGWAKAALRYYFLNDEEGMPPQGHMNTGQKLWGFMVLACGAVFLITGIIMWFFKTVAPYALLQWSVFVHDIVFIAAGVMLFVHIYLGVIHPLMTEAWKAIWKGTISTEYAKSHHGKWYEEVTKKGTEEG
ncbi:MAG TPA: hypothetical protein G4O12_08550 [Dehalococcoidia bacterium]|nr:hypothetical protein [Dehalococcoidia bacterium]